MKYGLKDDVIEKVQAVFARFPDVDRATLYGSRAKGNFKPGSDIDLTLHMSAQQVDALTEDQKAKLRDIVRQNGSRSKSRSWQQSRTNGPRWTKSSNPFLKTVKTAPISKAKQCCSEPHIIAMPWRWNSHA